MFCPCRVCQVAFLVTPFSDNMFASAPASIRLYLCLSKYTYLSTEGACVGTASIPATGTASALIILAHNFSDQPLELSVASKTAGVFSTPLEVGAPLVSKISTEDEEGEGGGCMLLSTLVRAYGGTEAVTETVGRDTQLVSFGDVSHQCVLPEKEEKEEEKEKPSSSPPTDLLVYHLEILDQDETPNSLHDPTRNHLITNGVMDGPVLSRLDLPLSYHIKHAAPTFGKRSQYFVGTSQLQEGGHVPTEKQDHSATIKAFQAQSSPNNFMYLNQHRTMSSSQSLRARLSILAVRVSTSMSGTASSEAGTDTDTPSPAARILASCLLTEAHRAVMPLEDNSLPDNKVSLPRTVLCFYCILLCGVLCGSPAMLCNDLLCCV